MSGATGAGDDYFDSAIASRGRIFEQQVGRTVSGNHFHFMSDLQFVESLRRRFKRFPIGRRAHDNADERPACGVFGGLHKRLV